MCKLKLYGYSKYVGSQNMWPLNIVGAQNVWVLKHVDMKRYWYSKDLCIHKEGY